MLFKSVDDWAGYSWSSIHWTSSNSIKPWVNSAGSWPNHHVFNLTNQIFKPCLVHGKAVWIDYTSHNITSLWKHKVLNISFSCLVPHLFHERITYHDTRSLISGLMVAHAKNLVQFMFHSFFYWLRVKYSIWFIILELVKQC